MNYLSHWYSEGCPDDVHFSCGLILPDMLPGFSKIYNKRVLHLNVPVSDWCYPIHQGILAHYTADKRFHNSKEFTAAIDAMLKGFVSIGLDRNRLRLSVIAHVAIELLLDRQILLSKPMCCTDLYAIIDKADASLLENYIAEVVGEQEKSLFLTNFLFFRKRKFLFMFSELNNMVSALNRIYSGVTRVSFTDTEKDMFLSALGNMDMEMRYKWQEILKG